VRQLSAVLRARLPLLLLAVTAALFAGLGRRKRRGDGGWHHHTAQPRLSERPVGPVDHAQPIWPGREVSFGDKTLYVRSTPPRTHSAQVDFVHPDDREAALFVHGLGGSAGNWTDLATLLAPRFAVDAIDLPGFGRSKPTGKYSIRTQTDLVIAYIENQMAKPVHLFGNSMGGLISLLVAARRPDLVRTLTLISPAVPDLNLRRQYRNPAALLAVPGLYRFVVLRKAAKMSPKHRAYGLLKLIMAQPRTLSELRLQETIEEILERDAMPWTGQSMLRAVRAILASHLVPGANGVWRQMSRIATPTLVIWGDRDRIVNVRMAPKVGRVMPDARVLVLPNIAHVAQIEDPVTTARAFLGFLEELDEREGLANLAGTDVGTDTAKPVSVR